MTRVTARWLAGLCIVVGSLLGGDAAALLDPPNPTVGTVPATGGAPATVDVMVLYTRTAEENFRIGAGNPSPPQDLAITEIQEALTYTNGALADSGAHVVLNPVHVACICSDDAPTAYCGSESDCSARPTLDVGGSDGETLWNAQHDATVNAWRDTYGADLVMVIVHGGSVNGIAGWPMQYGTAFDFEAFGLVFPGNTMGEEQDRTFAHELGHLLGAQHDWYDEGTRLAIYAVGDPEFSPSVRALHGFVHVEESEAGGPGDSSFMTIMAYPQQCLAENVTCRQVPYFSTSLVNEPQTGLPLGRLGDTNASDFYDVCLSAEPTTKLLIDDTSACPADVVSVFNAMAPYVAVYRSTSGPDGAPTSLTGTLHGSSMDLTWQDHATNELGFRIFRTPPAGLDYEYIGSVGPDVTAYTDPLQRTFEEDHELSWRYRVEAYNASGISSFAEVDVTVDPRCDGTIDYDFEPAGGGECPSLAGLDGTWVNDAESEPWSIALNPALGGTCALESFPPPGGAAGVSSLTLAGSVVEGFVCFDFWSPGLFTQVQHVDGRALQAGAGWSFGPLRIAVPVAATGTALRWDTWFWADQTGGNVYIDNLDLPLAPAGAPCGNGAVEFGETCDDGNTTSGDCCSATCGLESDGSPCEDGLYCTTGDACDGGGTCVAGAARDCDDGEACTTDACNEDGDACGHDPLPHEGEACGVAECMTAGACQSGACAGAGPVDDGTVCDDGDACTTEERCVAGVCTAGAFAPDGGTCDDGTLCTTGDACAGGVCRGTAAARSCRAPLKAGKAMLQLVGKPGTGKDRLRFTWRKGAATTLDEFGDPAGVDDYELCLLHEGSPEPLFAVRAPAGITCGGAPCWRGRRGTYEHRSRSGEPDGITMVRLKPGADGKAQIDVRGGGANLDVPTPPVAAPLRVELRTTANDGTVCWGADLTTIRKNAAGELKARGQ